MIPNLRDFKNLKYINDIKSIVITFLLCLTVYLFVKSPKIESSLKVELDTHLDEGTTRDSIQAEDIIFKDSINIK